MNYGANYAANKIAGIDTNFSWKNMAISVVSAEATSGLSSAMGTTQDNFTNNLINNFVGGAVQSTTSRVMGVGGKQNWGQIATDAFGNAIASGVVEASLGGSFWGAYGKVTDVNGNEVDRMSKRQKAVAGVQGQNDSASALRLNLVNEQRRRNGLAPLSFGDESVLSTIQSINATRDSDELAVRLNGYRSQLKISGVSADASNQTIERLQSAFQRQGYVSVLAGPITEVIADGDQIRVDSINSSADDYLPPSDAAFGIKTADHVLQGTGRLVRGFGEFLKDNPIAMYALEGIDFAAGPGLYVARKALAASPVGHMIEQAQQAMVGVVADMMTNAGYNPQDSVDGGIGALTLATLAISGAAGALSRLESVRGVVSSVTDRLAMAYASAKSIPKLTSWTGFIEKNYPSLSAASVSRSVFQRLQIPFEKIATVPSWLRDKVLSDAPRLPSGELGYIDPLTNNLKAYTGRENCN